MTISEKDVRHVMSLARLRLPDPDVEALTADLHAILDHIEVLEQADVGAVDPENLGPREALPMREDTPEPSLGPEGLEGSAGRQDRFIKVPRIVE